MKDILNILKLPKSVYYYWVRHVDDQRQKDLPILKSVREIIEQSKGRYGYRRIKAVLEQDGIIVNHKRLLRIMRTYDLLCVKFTKKHRNKYSSYRGTVGYIAPNTVNRVFKVDKVNTLWLTDVTEFSLPSKGKRLYLSTIFDSCTSEIIAYEMSRSPNLDIALKPLTDALSKHQGLLNELVIHSDQGFHYQHRAWVNILDTYNVTQSMSRKGNCLDNAPMENFFGLLKQEMFYGEQFDTYELLESAIREYIEFYNTKRIKTKLKGMSPVQYRKHTLKSA